MVISGLEDWSRVLKEKPEFDIFVFFDNPNIVSLEEYLKRKNEVKKVIMIFKENYGKKIELIEDNSIERQGEWFNQVCQFAKEREGGKRCELCYHFRLKESFYKAKELGFETVGTTLTLSPLKNSLKINLIGKSLEEESGINYLWSDFKKNGGFQKSVDFCKKYDIYRQNFCGCIFSLKKENPSST